MVQRFLRVPVLGLCAVLACASMAAAQPAKSYRAPLTPDGHTDLEGVWQNPPRGTLLEKGPLGEALTLSPADAAAKIKLLNEQLQSNPRLSLQADLPTLAPMKVRGEIRSRLLVQPADGVLPFTPTAIKAIDAWTLNYNAARSGAPIANPEDTDASQRCVMSEGQPPMRFNYEEGKRQIVQTPGTIAIYSEFMGEMRLIRMGGPFQPSTIRSHWGDSVGHWEGPVLVVETRNFNLQNPFHVALAERPVMVGPDSVIIERFRRVSADELDYSFTVRDPTLYTGPWLAEYAMFRSNGQVGEYACHEGNYSQANILQGSRDAEAALAPKR